MALLSGNSETRSACCGTIDNRFPPFARHAGFTAVLTSIAARLAQAATQAVVRRWRSHRGRTIVRQMLSYDDHILADLDLMRGDLLCAMQTRSGIDPTSRLRLMSIERRTLRRADFTRRADYIASLIPAPFNGRAADKPASKRTEAY